MPDETLQPSVSGDQQAPIQAASPNAAAKSADRAPEQVGLRVSLIPDEEINQHDPRAGFKKWLLAVCIAIAVMGGVCGFLGYKVHVAKTRVAELNSQTEAYQKKTAELAPSVADTKLTQARLKALGSLLANRRSVASIFSFVEKHTLQDVAYSSISIAENGGVNLTATGASYEAYAGQINELRAQPEIKGMSASGLSPVYGSDGALQSVNFTLSLNFDPSIFLLQKP